MSLRVFIVGDKGVGKTSLVTKFFSEDYPRVAYRCDPKRYEKRIQIDDRMWTLEIITGNESWLCHGYDQVACCVLVYDVYNRTSFDNLTKHIDNFVALAHPKAYKFKYVVLGNKIDRRSQRAVLKEEALQWCYYNRDALYFETSAIEGENVDAAFAQIARCAIDYIPHLRGGQVYNLQDIVQNDERWLEASEVYLIKDHMNILYQYKTEVPFSPTPGLFLTSTNYNLAAGSVWMASEITTLPRDSDDERDSVSISYAWCSMDGKPLGRYIYHLKFKRRFEDMYLVHYMFR